jgi:hypothetical protein
MDRIVVELNARADLQTRIAFTQPVDLVKIDSAVISIVISESDIG